jgi:hypothetical protein
MKVSGRADIGNRWHATATTPAHYLARARNHRFNTNFSPQT